MVGTFDSRNLKNPLNSNFPEASMETMSQKKETNPGSLSIQNKHSKNHSESGGLEHEGYNKSNIQSDVLDKIFNQNEKQESALKIDITKQKA